MMAAPRDDAGHDRFIVDGKVTRQKGYDLPGPRPKLTSPAGIFLSHREASSRVTKGEVMARHD